MVRPVTLCTDNITKMEIVTMETSFKEACDFLEWENMDGRFGKYKATEHVGSVEKFVFEKAIFYYDEARKLLLRK